MEPVKRAVPVQEQEPDFTNFIYYNSTEIQFN